MKIIKKKTWPDYFAKIVSGQKKFDCRLADFECEIGDQIVFQEYDPKNQKYTGREITKTVGFILKTKDAWFWSKTEINKHGFIIMSLNN